MSGAIPVAGRNVIARAAGIVGLLALTALVLVGCAGNEGGSQGPTLPTSSPGPDSPADVSHPATTGTARAVCNPAKPMQAKDGSQKIKTGEGERSYLLSLPQGYDGVRPVGLILNMHGSGSNKEQQVLLTDLPKKAAARGYAVVSPDGTGRPQGFNMFGRQGSPDDYAFLDSLIAKLSNELCIDADRVYSTGISNGSAMSMFVACHEPYRFAAVALVAATVPGNCPDSVRPSVLAFHGTGDRIVPYVGGTVNASAADGVAAPGAESTMAAWAKRYGCDSSPQVSQQGAARHTLWTCPGEEGVELYSLEGAGHTWPGGLDLEAIGIKQLGSTNKDVSATDTMLDFFDAHRRSWR